MITTGDLENLERGEVRLFNYSKLAKELGEFPRYKQYDRAECEEVVRVEIIDGDKVQDYGWEIIGTNKVVEYQWTDPL